MAITITSNKLLVVEGSEEQFVFEALARARSIDMFQILPIGGKTKLKANPALLVVSPGFNAVTSLSIVRDANGDPPGAFQSVSTALSAVGLPCPTSASAFQGSKPKVGVFILPGGDRPGALEDLYLQAVSDQPAFQCLSPYFECLKASGVPPSREPAKAKTQAFLASLAENYQRLGEAAQAGNFPFDAAAFDDLVRFLVAAAS